MPSCTNCQKRGLVLLSVCKECRNDTNVIANPTGDICNDVNVLSNGKEQSNLNAEIFNDSYWEKMDELLNKKFGEFEFKIKAYVTGEIKKHTDPLHKQLEAYDKVVENQQSFLERVANNMR